MAVNLLSNNVLLEARARAGLSQRALARRAGTAQSVVARIELGTTSPTTQTLGRLLDAAGFELGIALRPKLSLGPEELDDVPRILSLAPEARLQEVANLSRFFAAVRSA